MKVTHKCLRFERHIYLCGNRKIGRMKNTSCGLDTANRKETHVGAHAVAPRCAIQTLGVIPTAQIAVQDASAGCFDGVSAHSHDPRLFCGRGNRLADDTERGLVLVRAGQGHRFAALTNIPAYQRSWDLAFSFYHHVALPTGSSVEWTHYYNGGKWDGIWNFFAVHPDLLHRYDYFWLVDDDIEIEPQWVDKLFDYVRRNAFRLAQPALTHDSYFSHRLTLACPGFLHRHTNLVEIMAPIISRDILEKVLPLFEHTRSGFGLDWYWQRLVPDPSKQIAIVDSLPVRHARPLGKNLRALMLQDGLAPEQERTLLASMLGINRIHCIATSGVTEDGKRVEGRMRMAYIMAKSLWRIRKQIIQRHWGVKETAVLVVRQVISPLGYVVDKTQIKSRKFRNV